MCYKKDMELILNNLINYILTWQWNNHIAMDCIKNKYEIKFVLKSTHMYAMNKSVKCHIFLYDTLLYLNICLYRKLHQLWGNTNIVYVAYTLQEKNNMIKTSKVQRE